MNRRSCICAALAGFMGILTWAPTASAQHPLASSTADWLGCPDGEYTDIAVSPDGSRLYLMDVGSHSVVVWDPEADALIDTISFGRWLDGIALTPDGSQLVVAASEEYVYTIDTATLAILGSDDAWDVRGGSVAVTPDGSTAYVAGYWEIHVVRLTAAGPELVDTTAGGGAMDGLDAANSWGDDFINANRILVSADGSSLFVGIWQTPIHVISDIAGGTNHDGLVLQTLPVAREGDTSVKLCLSADGSLLYDSKGYVRRTSDLSLVGEVDLEVTHGAAAFSRSLDSRDIAVDPNDRYIYYVAFAELYGEEGYATYPGDQLIVASGTTYSVLDLDHDPNNGLTGIDLPVPPRGAGTYNNHTMIMAPDGESLYMAAGTSGVLAVSLAQGAGGIYEITPRRGGDNGDVTMTIQGEGFEPGSTVSLVRAGQADIAATETTIHDTTTITTRFNLRGQARGACDVVVTHPGGEQSRLNGVFAVEEGREGAVLDMLGDEALLVGGTSRLRVVCQNTGNTDLTDVIVTLQLTAGTSYKVELPPAVIGGLSQVDAEFTTATAGHPEYIWIGRVPPEGSYSFWLNVQGPVGVAPIYWDVSLEAAVGFVQTGDRTPAKYKRHASEIGDLCTIADSIVKSIDRQLQARGNNVPEGQIRVNVDQIARDVLAEFGASKVSSMIAKALARMVVVALVPEALPVFAVTFDAVGDIKSCFDFFRTLKNFNALFAWDPNDKISSSGVNGHILATQKLHYVIHFENLPEATAAATNVVITDELDDDLNASTLSVGESSHPGILTTEVEPGTRRVTFTFTGIDLPPNVTPPEGEGWVEFTVRPMSGLASGTEIRNQASIVFDLNPPIVTPEIVHTVDTEPPASAVAELPESTGDETIPVQWSGVDGGVGIWDYNVYVSVNDGRYTTWLEGTSDTSASYSAEPGNTYRFHSVARDLLGNTESAPSTPDATIAVEAKGPCACGNGAGGAIPVLLLGLAWLKAATSLLGRRPPNRSS